MKKITVVIERGKDGIFSAYTPDTKLTVLNGQGKTVKAAVADLKQSLNEVIESFRESGEEVPEEISGDIQFLFKYDIASLFNHFDEINLSSFARKNNMNESLLRKYKNGLAYASEKQCRKIELGLHRLGESLCTVRL